MKRIDAVINDELQMVTVAACFAFFGFLFGYLGKGVMIGAAVFILMQPFVFVPWMCESSPPRWMGVMRPKFRSCALSRWVRAIWIESSAIIASLLLGLMYGLNGGSADGLSMGGGAFLMYQLLVLQEVRRTRVIS